MNKTRVGHMVSFGALMLMLAGAFNVLDGVVALANPDYLKNDLLVGDLTAWGIGVALFGAIQLLCGAAVLLGSEVALWPGIVLAALNAVVHLANVAQSPVWSVAIIVADGLVIYGFAARGLTVGVEMVDTERDEDVPMLDTVGTSAQGSA